MRHKEYLMAEEAFNQAESSNENNVLSTDQKLELWIQQSECAKALQQMDKAMLILSKVINDNTISSLRVKAMYLRAEIYALQGRHELARKQLTATVNKGGEWAAKAKIQLEETYGSH
jgi:tetratricopeptide (TPR) repeat protein